MQLCFIGTGYVGLVSGAMLSHLGHHVTCIDKDKDKISALQSGIVPIYEQDLEKHIKASTDKGLLQFSSSYDNTTNFDAIFIAVGTPSTPSGDLDLRYINEALIDIVTRYPAGILIVIKSTVPPGTCAILEQKIKDMGSQHEIASNPEFLREGSAVYDFLNPDRIVIGARSERAKNVLQNIYAPLAGKQIISTNTVTAELIKYASNAFLATKIAFINEMANLCEKVGANVDTLSTGLGSDHRIGKEFLKAGPGFGGSCFPKDIVGLSRVAKEYSQPCHVVDAVIFSNQNRRAHMVSKISDVLGPLVGKTICVLGITFKAGTDDVRSSPAVDIVSILLSQGAKVNIYDPEGSKNASPLLPKATFVKSAFDAASDAHCIVILTEWQEFTKLDFEKIGSVMIQRVLFDFRNILSQDLMREHGFGYYAIGR